MSPTASLLDKVCIINILAIFVLWFYSILQILAEFTKPDVVKIRNPAKVSEKVEMLVTHGSKALQVILY
jgi:hypothetical protein